MDITEWSFSCMKEKERNDFFLHKELEGSRCCELFVICMDNKIYS